MQAPSRKKERGRGKILPRRKREENTQRAPEVLLLLSKGDGKLYYLPE